MRHWETNGRALESSGARKPTERCPEGAVQKNRQAGDESDSAGKPREENREKRHRKGNRNTAEGGWRGNPREQTARKRDRPKKPGDKGRAGGCPVRQPPAPLSISPVLMALHRLPPAGRR